MPIRLCAALAIISIAFGDVHTAKAQNVVGTVRMLPQTTPVPAINGPVHYPSLPPVNPQNGPIDPQPHVPTSAPGYYDSLSAWMRFSREHNDDREIIACAEKVIGRRIEVVPNGVPPPDDPKISSIALSCASQYEAKLAKIRELRANQKPITDDELRQNVQESLRNADCMRRAQAALHDYVANNPRGYVDSGVSPQTFIEHAYQGCINQ